MFLAWLIPDIPCMAVGVARIVSMIVWASCAIGSEDIKSCSFRWVTGLAQRFIASSNEQKEEDHIFEWAAFVGICCIYVIMLGMYAQIN